jgi:glycosyltransferase involved in cell wall biosynthesis
MTPHSLPAAGVTVVTAVFNGRSTLEDTLSSVRAQTWPDVRHVAVDGGSTDGTRELLESQGDSVRWISEKDRGLYDAMNKGLALIDDPSRYVIFLNSDDVFHGHDAVERVMCASSGEDLVYGRLERFDEELDYRDVIGREVDQRDMLFGMKCHHQAVFCRRAVFDTIGRFDLGYRIAADYDWMVRAFRDPRVSRRHVPVVVSTMRRGGLSDVRYLDSVRERWRVVRAHYPRLDQLRYAAYSGFGDYGRYWLQQGMKRVGLLNAARDAKRALRGRPS